MTVHAQPTAGPDVVVHVSGTGNLYMTEIAESLANAAATLGRGGTLEHDHLPVEDGRVHLVVAPHEFFPLHPLAGTDELREAAVAAVCVNVEQPGTPWFETAAEWAGLGRGCLDINPLGTAELRRRGVEAHRLQLGYDPLRDRSDGAEQRDVDLVYLGDDSPKRVDALSRRHDVLATRRCELRFFRSNRPVRPGRAGFLDAPQRTALLARSRVLVNIHRGDADYFEWVRLLDAMANGCVVVSEPSADLAPLVPGVHLLEAAPDQVVSVAAALLSDEPERRRIADAARTLLRDDLRLDRLLDDTLARLDPSPAVDDRPAEDRPSEDRRPASRPGTPPVVPADVPVTVTTDERVSALRTAIAGDAPAAVESLPRGPSSRRPHCVVLVTRNDASTVAAAIDAALADEDAEVVVLDAGSSDETVSIVEHLLATRPWAPVRLRTAWGADDRSQVLPLIADLDADGVLVATGSTLLTPGAATRLARLADDAGADAAVGIGVHEGRLVHHVPEPPDPDAAPDPHPAVHLRRSATGAATAYLHDIVAEYR